MPVKQLVPGEVGYVATGFKSVRDAQVGDTVTAVENPAPKPLPGYKPAKALVFAGIYPVDGEDYPDLRDALEKLHLNDASISFTPETSVALGFGFRLGFLGLLHMEIVQERLEREFDLDLIASAPSVEYRVTLINNQGDVLVDNPARLPPIAEIESIAEPWVRVNVVTPTSYIGPLMELATGRRGTFENMEYLDPERVLISLRAAAGGGHRRLLRPAEKPVAGLRLARLRRGRATEPPTSCASTCWSPASRSMRFR